MSDSCDSPSQPEATSAAAGRRPLLRVLADELARHARDVAPVDDEHGVLSAFVAASADDTSALAHLERLLREHIARDD